MNNLNNNKIFHHKTSHKNKNINNYNLQTINLNEIKSFYPKKINDVKNSKFENDDTTFKVKKKNKFIITKFKLLWKKEIF